LARDRFILWSGLPSRGKFGTCREGDGEEFHLGGVRMKKHSVSTNRLIEKGEMSRIGGRPFS